MTRGPPSPEAKCTSLTFLRPGDWGCSDLSADAVEQESDQGYAQQASYEVEVLRQLTSRFIFDPLIGFATNASWSQVPPVNIVEPLEQLATEDALRALRFNFASYPKALQLLFPAMGLAFDYIPQAQCPVNIPAESELIRDNESNSSGIDLLEELGGTSGRGRHPAGTAERSTDPAVGGGQRPSTWPSTSETPAFFEGGRKQPIGSLDNAFPGSDLSGTNGAGEMQIPPRGGPSDNDSSSGSSVTGSPARDLADVQTRQQRSESDAARMDQCQRIANALTSRLNLPTASTELSSYVIALGQREGLTGLDREKRKVKYILRKYDSLFQRHYGTAPTRTEKEPMRQLYIYYRKVKVTMDRLSASNAPRTSSNVVAPRRRRETSELQPAGPEKRSARRDSATYGSDLGLDDSRPGEPRSGPTYSNRSLEDLERKLANMVGQKQQLAKRLQAYQEVFEQRHGRRIRYHRDIVEIDGDYRKYKKLRASVAQLTETVKARRCLLTARGERTSAIKD